MADSEGFDLKHDARRIDTTTRWLVRMLHQAGARQLPTGGFPQRRAVPVEYRVWRDDAPVRRPGVRRSRIAAPAHSPTRPPE